MKNIYIFLLSFLAFYYSNAQDWQWQNPKPTGNSLSSAYFTSVDTGYIVGDCGTILKTINGGITWNSLSIETSVSLISVYFTDSNTGYAVGQNGMIIKTTDAGLNWTIQESGTTEDLYSVQFPDADTGYISGSNSILLKTSNG